ncbi:MAG TPA: acyltransferase [Ferruginibacter sp.]|nr:acyltransferase [Ferruginibacter sp.]
MKYIKQLDSLRAIAVILVIISHWIPTTNLINRIPNGAIGVDIFFVLSGFLISKILFDNKNRAEELNISKSSLIKNFYVRRTLRIFPIYYLTIFILLLFSKYTGTNIQSAFVYFVTYTSNFYFFNIQGWDGMVSHLWSLAVEEQFYLIWPWIILFSNKKYFLHIISIFIFIGVLSQYLMSGIKMSSVLTFTCFDAFGLGAILAWIITYANEKLNKFYTIISVASAISFFLFILGIIQNKWTIIPFRTLVSVITLWIITYIIINRDTKSLKFKFILNNRVLIFLGKISYGLYLYHNIIPGTLNSKIINIYINPLLPDILYKKYWGQLYLLENTILLVTISWLSFIFIEKRFLSLKKHFEYQEENSVQQKYLQKQGSTL